MPERLVDVESRREVLHTFPVTTSDPAMEEEAFKGSAGGCRERQAGPERGTREPLRHMHVSRSGQLTRYRDSHGVLAETKAV